MTKSDIKNNLLKLKSKQEITQIKNIEALGVDLYIKQISGKMRMRMADKAKEYYGITPEDVKDKSKEELMNLEISNEAHYKYLMLLLSITLCDEEGQLIFDDEQEAEIFIDNFPDDIFKNIVEQVEQVNGINSDADTKKPSETLEKTEN